MAEAILTHFREFDPTRAVGFSKVVFEAVGFAIYGLPPERVTTADVTLIVANACPGSRTSATAGSELKVDLDDEEWPIKESMMEDQAAAKQHCLKIKQALGRVLLGGVDGLPDAIVNVWVRQFVATGWYGVGYQK